MEQQAHQGIDMCFQEDEGGFLYWRMEDGGGGGRGGGGAGYSWYKLRHDNRGGSTHVDTQQYNNSAAYNQIQKFNQLNSTMIPEYSLINRRPKISHRRQKKKSHHDDDHARSLKRSRPRGG